MSDTPHNHSRSGDKRRRLTVDDNVIYLNFGRYRDTEADTGGQGNSVANRRHVNLSVPYPRRQRTDSQRESDALVLVVLVAATIAARTRGQPQ